MTGHVKGSATTESWNQSATPVMAWLLRHRSNQPAATANTDGLLSACCDAPTTGIRRPDGQTARRDSPPRLANHGQEGLEAAWESLQIAPVHLDGGRSEGARLVSSTPHCSEFPKNDRRPNQLAIPSSTRRPLAQQSMPSR